MKNIVNQVVYDLQALQDDKRKKFNLQRGWTGPQFGISLGKLRAYAKKHKIDHELGLELSQSDNLDLLILSCLLLDGKKMTNQEIEQIMPSYPQLVDEYVNSVVSKNKNLKELSLQWIEHDQVNFQQAGWQGLVHCVEDFQCNEGEIEILLTKIEQRLQHVSGSVQFNMNHCLASIGIENEKFRKKAYEIAEKCGVYKDMKVSKGCTSPYAISWMDVILSKRGLTNVQK